MSHNEHIFKNELFLFSQSPLKDLVWFIEIKWKMTELHLFEVDSQIVKFSEGPKAKSPATLHLFLPIVFVSDNQRLALHWRQRTARREVHLKSFKARLAVDYPVYSMVVCQVINKLKLVLLFAAQYLTEWVKMTSYFRQLQLVSTAFCLLQIRHRDEIVQ